jgi:hypothetical protein
VEVALEIDHQLVLEEVLLLLLVQPLIQTELQILQQDSPAVAAALLTVKVVLVVVAAQGMLAAAVLHLQPSTQMHLVEAG